MSQRCLKCEHVAEPNYSEAAVCPNRGAFYAKVMQSATSMSPAPQPAPHSRTSRIEPSLLASTATTAAYRAPQRMDEGKGFSNKGSVIRSDTPNADLGWVRRTCTLNQSTNGRVRMARIRLLCLRAGVTKTEVILRRYLRMVTC